MGTSIYRKARELKDRHYDGKFFFAVKSTNVFCRPSCPAPVAKEENVEYFETMFEAVDQGYRPCLRCQPDIHIEYFNGNADGTSIVDSALELIYNGYLNDRSVSDLSGEFNVTDRHLRQLFIDNLGMPPVRVAKYHRAMFAHKLLLQSGLSVTDVAFASGFGSTRQFNDVFKEVYKRTPTEVRREASQEVSVEAMVMRIPYIKPFAYDQILEFMAHRAIESVEAVHDGVYSRTFRIEDYYGYFSVENDEKASVLKLKIHSNDIRCMMPLYYRVKRMFDIDADLFGISEYLATDDLLRNGMKDGIVPRLPVAFNTFEFVIRAILGQQITVKAATTLAGRVAKAGGIHLSEMDGMDKIGPLPEGLQYCFPTPEELSRLNLEGLGITGIRQRTIKTVVNAILNGHLSLSSNQSYEAFHKAFIALKGIGDWTVNYVAMRGLGMVDAFPAKDLGVIKALMVDGNKPKHKEILEQAESWRPYRAYATLCLWHGFSEKETE